MKQMKYVPFQSRYNKKQNSNCFPTFKNVEWENTITKFLNEDYQNFMALYGPSLCGKSFALQNSLQGKKGVVFMDFREKMWQSVVEESLIGTGTLFQRF